MPEPSHRVPSRKGGNAERREPGDPKDCSATYLNRCRHACGWSRVGAVDRFCGKQRAGYRVFEANDGHEALKLWTKHRNEIDLLLTDMVMPNGMTGCELSQRLLVDQPNLPVIYSSGYSIELTAPGFNENERLVFLPKPYLTGQLLTVVDRCLSKAG